MAGTGGPWPLWSSLDGRLVGREVDLEVARHLLNQPEIRLLTLTGTAGVGKTTLAVAVAESVRDAFRDGVFFVDLASLTDATLVMDAIGRAVGLRESGRARLAATVRTYLQSRQLLLVLDNFEHVLSAAADVASLLAACPELSAVVTSRAPLSVPGEREVVVPPLAVPGVRADLAAETVSQVPSVVLFGLRAEAVSPGFRVSEANAAVVAEICARLDGLPLAVELAAARVKALDVDQILARLQDRFQLLAAPHRGVPERHRSLRRAVDWSYGLMTETERALFRSLSVFAGGWELDAAESVCAGRRAGVASVAVEDVVDVLSRLVDHSMVVVEERAGRKRYRFLETLRQYAAERLAEAGEDRYFRERHRDWFLELAEQAAAAIAGPGEADWLDRLDADHDNLRAALDYSEVAGVDPEAGLRLAGSLFRYWDVRGYLSEGSDRLTRLLQRTPPDAVTVGRAQALHALGTLALGRAELSVAPAALAESAALGRLLGSHRLEIWPLSMAAFQAFLAQDHVRCRQLAAQAHALALEARDEVMLIRTYCACGIVEALHGDPARGWQLLAESLTIARRLGATWGIGNVLYMMGWVAWSEGDADRATELVSKAVGMLWSLGDRRTVPDCLDILGCASLGRGDFERGVRLFGLATHMRQTTGAGRQPYLDGAYAQAHASARDQLGGARFDACWSAGYDRLPVLRIGDPAAVTSILDDSINLPRTTGAGTRLGTVLTAREAQIAQLVTGGLTNRQIAAELTISERTAERHLENVRVKLGVNSRAEVAAWAAVQGRMPEVGQLA